MSLPAGARLGPYEILAPLGAGGMGEVYRGRGTRVRSRLKVLSEHLASDTALIERFERDLAFALRAVRDDAAAPK